MSGRLSINVFQTQCPGIPGCIGPTLFKSMSKAILPMLVSIDMHGMAFGMLLPCLIVGIDKDAKRKKVCIYIYVIYYIVPNRAYPITLS